MNIWAYLPRSLRQFLLEQPVADTWKTHIRASLEPSTDEYAAQNLGLAWKRSYDMVAALAVLCISAFIMYLLLG